MRRGLVGSRAAAQDAIGEGRVLVGGAPAEKAARMVGPGEPVIVTPAEQGWVSRGGTKLDAALDRFSIVVEGARCLDAGASTGGFTDVLLARGAAQVWAVDVGRGQLHDRLVHHDRVVARDRVNIRLATLDDLGAEPFDVVVADLSFISLRTVAPVLAGEVPRAGADLVCLVKPQFEAGRRLVSAGKGVVREPSAWRDALVGVGHALQAEGAAIMGVMTSPLRGASGNVEFLLWARAHAAGGGDLVALADAAVADVGTR